MSGNHARNHARQLAKDKAQKGVGNQTRDVIKGRGGGLYERNLALDRKEHNSDDEDFDEFGRRRKKKQKRADATEKSTETPTDHARENAAEKQPLSASSTDGLQTHTTEEQDMSGCSGLASAMYLAAQQSGQMDMADMQAQVQQHAFMVQMMALQSAGWATASEASTSTSSQARVNRAPIGNIIYSDESNASKGSELRAKLPCKFFSSTGRCIHGANCDFSHKPATIAAAAGAGGVKKRQYCNFYGAGKCVRGNNCPYIHGVAEEGKPVNIEAEFQKTIKRMDFVDFDTGLQQSELPPVAKVAQPVPKAGETPIDIKKTAAAHVIGSAQNNIPLAFRKK